MSDRPVKKNPSTVLLGAVAGALFATMLSIRRGVPPGVLPLLWNVPPGVLSLLWRVPLCMLPLCQSLLEDAAESDATLPCFLHKAARLLASVVRLVLRKVELLGLPPSRFSLQVPGVLDQIQNLHLFSANIGDAPIGLLHRVAPNVFEVPFGYRTRKFQSHQHPATVSRLRGADRFLYNVEILRHRPVDRRWSAEPCVRVVALLARTVGCESKTARSL